VLEVNADRDDKSLKKSEENGGEPKRDKKLKMMYSIFP
jgi:hypothetical protein